MAEGTLNRARAGDEIAFRELTDPYRRELQVHCYRIVGSMQDAEDLVQETLLSAWRGLDGFEGRASLRAWLYRIASNRCLKSLRARARRPREVGSMTDLPEPTRRGEPIWLEPYPDVLLDGIPDDSPGPDARYEMREATELAFVAALQHLPARQRAVLVLRDVLGFRAAEVAGMLGTSEVAVKGLLQRARATIEAQAPGGRRASPPPPNSAAERSLVGSFADAIECGDIDEIVELLTDDAWLRMPPQPLEYQGRELIASFIRLRTERHCGQPLRLVPTRANGQPAFGCYLPIPPAEIARPYGLMVLTLEADLISAVTWFADCSVFPHFGLPRALRDRASDERAE
jgi:RNA polymerase sigma-70 factor (TIGR02960 family)